MTEPVIHVSIEPALVDKDTACKMLGGISVKQLERLVADDELTARKLGIRTVFEVEELRRFAASLPDRKPK